MFHEESREGTKGLKYSIFYEWAWALKSPDTLEMSLCILDASSSPEVSWADYV